MGTQSTLPNSLDIKCCIFDSVPDHPHVCSLYFKTPPASDTQCTVPYTTYDNAVWGLSAHTQNRVLLVAATNSTGFEISCAVIPHICSTFPISWQSWISRQCCTFTTYYVKSASHAQYILQVINPESFDSIDSDTGTLVPSAGTSPCLGMSPNTSRNNSLSVIPAMESFELEEVSNNHCE